MDGGTGYASRSDMSTVMVETKSKPAQAERAQRDIEQECETWDWARAAGVSAQELRKAVRDSLGATAD
jgi:hypothetical protein